MGGPENDNRFRVGVSAPRAENENAPNRPGRAGGDMGRGDTGGAAIAGGIMAGFADASDRRQLSTKHERGRSTHVATEPTQAPQVLEPRWLAWAGESGRGGSWVPFPVVLIYERLSMQVGLGWVGRRRSVEGWSPQEAGQVVLEAGHHMRAKNATRRPFVMHH